MSEFCGTLERTLCAFGYKVALPLSLSRCLQLHSIPSFRLIPNCMKLCGPKLKKQKKGKNRHVTYFRMNKSGTCRRAARNGVARNQNDEK